MIEVSPKQLQRWLTALDGADEGGWLPSVPNANVNAAMKEIEAKLAEVEKIPASPPVPKGPMMWIAYDAMGPHIGGREQFNGDRPAWGESELEFASKQGIDVPDVGDELHLKMGVRRVYEKRLEAPETDGAGNYLTAWYWTLMVR